MANYESENAINELSFYTLEHPDKTYFIHQHVVDAYKAQTMNYDTSPIGIVFSLIGLYLFVENDYTGKQVQLAHMKMAGNKKPWAKIQLPDNRGSITVNDVLTTNPGEERDEMIRLWCIFVWEAFKSSHDAIATIAREELGLG